MPDCVSLTSAYKVVVVILFLSTSAAASVSGDGFSGRWRMDNTSFRGNVKPTIIELGAGNFSKDGDAIIKADGQLHPYPEDLYVDERAISIESDHVVKETDKIRGELAYTVEYVISADGNTLTWRVGNYTNPNGRAVESETVQRRVGPPIKGAHLISGKWERVSVTVDSKSDWILKLDGNHFSWRTEGGTGYDALIGGKSVRIDGDNSGARALITRPRPDTIVETDFSAKGMFDDVLSMQLMPDKKTIHGVARTRTQTKPTTFYLHRIVE